MQQKNSRSCLSDFSEAAHDLTHVACRVLALGIVEPHHCVKDKKDSAVNAFRHFNVFSDFGRAIDLWRRRRAVLAPIVEVGTPSERQIVKSLTEKTQRILQIAVNHFLTGHTPTDEILGMQNVSAKGYREARLASVWRAGKKSNATHRDETFHSPFHGSYLVVPYVGYCGQNAGSWRGLLPNRGFSH
jgi:hypothetical protein